MEIFKKNTLFIFIVFVIFSANGYARKCQCSINGNWSNASTWTPAGVPVCGDTVIVPAGFTVYVAKQQDYSTCTTPMVVYVYGLLYFTNGNKLRLSCDSYVIIYSGGVIDADVGLSNSNLIDICGKVEWNSNTTLEGVACLPPSHPYCASVLPIELTYFKAETCRYDEICFNWETVAEINNHHYEVERSSDAVNFRTVLVLDSKAPDGNSHYQISYTGTDESPVTGINYYRLKQVDFDNSNTYSKIISVHLVVEKELQFLVFPNFNSGEFTAQITGLKKSENISVLLRDPAGSIVYKALHHVDEAFTKIKVVPQFKLHDGIYFCSFIIGNSEHVVKIIVDSN